MNARWIVLLVLLAGAAWLALFGDRTPSGVVAAAPVSSATTDSAPSVPVARSTTEPALIALIPREQLFTRNDRRAGTNLFASRDWSPAPPPTRTKPVVPPPPAPVAPELPFIYVGKKLQEGSWEAYLVQDDKTLIVREGTVIDDAYRIERIEPPVLVLTYLPLQQSQTLNIGSAK